MGGPGDIQPVDGPPSPEDSLQTPDQRRSGDDDGLE